MMGGGGGGGRGELNIHFLVKKKDENRLEMSPYMFNLLVLLPSI